MRPLASKNAFWLPSIIEIEPMISPFEPVMRAKSLSGFVVSYPCPNEAELAVRTAISVPTRQMDRLVVARIMYPDYQSCAILRCLAPSKRFQHISRTPVSQATRELRHLDRKS